MAGMSGGLFLSLFREPRPVVGMVHLAPLPGSPRWAGSMQAVFEAARSDAASLVQHGLDGLLIENYGDLPFFPDRVPPAAVAGMTAVLQRLREAFPGVPWGVNVLRNDAEAALSVAIAAGARFIRVNVHCGAVVSDQGILEGRAAATLRLRAAIAPQVAILADARVKHATPLGEVSLEQEVADLVERGLADGVLVTGPRTGSPAADGVLERAVRAASGVPVLAASGVTPASVGGLLRAADGVIVGTCLKRDGRTEAPVDPERVRVFMESVRAARAALQLETKESS